MLDYLNAISKIIHVAEYTYCALNSIESNSYRTYLYFYKQLHVCTLSMQTYIWLYYIQDPVMSISYQFITRVLAITLFITSYFELKLTLYVSTLFMQSETKFQLDPMKKCKISPYTPIPKIVQFWQRHVYTRYCQKWAIFKNGDLWRNSMDFVGPN